MTRLYNAPGTVRLELRVYVNYMLKGMASFLL